MISLFMSAERSLLAGQTHFLFVLGSGAYVQ